VTLDAPPAPLPEAAPAVAAAGQDASATAPLDLTATPD
jgi:hypothetical protein